MTDSEIKNVSSFVVEYYIYIDIMSSRIKEGDIIVQSEENNEQTN